VVVGGLLVSTFFTLFLTPALMSLMLDAQSAVLRMMGRGGPARSEEAGTTGLERAPQPALPN
jgi:hypothetical protein